MTGSVTASVLALLAGLGVHLLWTSIAFGRSGVLPFTAGSAGLTAGRGRRAGAAARSWLTQVGLAEVRVAEFAFVVATLSLLGGLVGFLVFGAPVPALLIAAFAGSAPPAAYRRRRRARRALAMDAWPRMIEEIRLLTTSLGRSIPQALFEAGSRAPDELRPAFEAAHREWLLTTDFERTLRTLKSHLADPTADTTCETLLIAHDVGGPDLGRRLAALAEDRRGDVANRKDARSKQAGVRFARRFVLLVPLGMAVAGMSVGTGRARVPDSVRPGHGGDRCARGGGMLELGREAAAPPRSGTGLPRMSRDTRLISAIAVALLVGLTLLLSELRWFARPPLVERLAPYSPRHGSSGRTRGLVTVDSFREVVAPLARSTGESLSRILGSSEALEVRLRRLHSPVDATELRMRQLAGSCAALGLGVLLSQLLGLGLLSALLFVLGLPLLAFLVVEQRIASRSAAKQQRIFLELPVVAEQLGMLLGAGYSLGTALHRLAARGTGACTRDLRNVCARTQQGLTEAEALGEWAELADVPELTRLVGVLALNSEAGDLGHLISEEARSTRREVQRRTVETIERRGQQVWIPVTVATLVPGVIFLAVPFVEAMRLFASG